MNNRYDCARVQEELAALAEDAIPQEAAAHLAGCDECRDLLHDARLTASALRDGLGADFVPMDGDALSAKVLAALDARAAASPPMDAPVATPRAAQAPPAAEPVATATESRPRATKTEGTIVARRRIGRSILGVGIFAAAASVAVVVAALRGPSVSPPDAPDQPRVIPAGPIGPWHATLGRVIGAGVTVKPDGASDFAAARPGHRREGGGVGLGPDGHGREGRPPRGKRRAHLQRQRRGTTVAHRGGAVAQVDHPHVAVVRRRPGRAYRGA